MPYDVTSFPAQVEPNSFIDHVERMTALRSKVADKIRQETSDYNLRANETRSNIEYEIGDLVMVQFPRVGSGRQVTKLLPHYSGPWIVTEKLGNSFYNVQWRPENTDQKPRKTEHKIHIQRMKNFHSRK